MQSGAPQAWEVRLQRLAGNPEQASHLFGAFQRYHPQDELDGDGIGLATVQRLVAKHSGRIWAEAEVGTGTAFFFTLPAAPAGD